MGSNASTRHSLERSDYYSLGLIILYAVYAYLSIGGVFDALIRGSDQPGWLTLSNYFVPLAVFGLVLLSIGKQRTKPDDWGLSVNKRSLIANSGFFMGIVVFGLFDGDFPPADFYVRIVPVLLVVAAGQVALRARVISLMRKFMGTSVISTIVMFSFGALFFALVYTPVEPLSLWVILFSCFAVGFIRHSGSVLMLICIEPSIFITGELNDLTQNTFLALATTTIVIYFVFATAAWFLFRSRSRGAQAVKVVT